MGWKEEHTYEKRHNESRRVKLKHPHRVPIICEPGDTTIGILDKKNI